MCARTWKRSRSSCRTAANMSQPGRSPPIDTKGSLLILTRARISQATRVSSKASPEAASEICRNTSLGPTPPPSPHPLPPAQTRSNATTPNSSTRTRTSRSLRDNSECPLPVTMTCCFSDKEFCQRQRKRQTDSFKTILAHLMIACRRS